MILDVDRTAAVIKSHQINELHATQCLTCKLSSRPCHGDATSCGSDHHKILSIEWCLRLRSYPNLGTWQYYILFLVSTSFLALISRVVD